jgi:hypothetical protein
MQHALTRTSNITSKDFFITGEGLSSSLYRLPAGCNEETVPIHRCCIKGKIFEYISKAVAVKGNCVTDGWVG